MDKKMMIDYRNDDNSFERKVIDNFEFCIRDGMAYFASNGAFYKIPLQKISQVYTY